MSFGIFTFIVFITGFFVSNLLIVPSTPAISVLLPPLLTKNPVSLKVNLLSLISIMVLITVFLFIILFILTGVI